MKPRARSVCLALAVGILTLTVLGVASWILPRKEPIYQEKPLSFWVMNVGKLEQRKVHEDAVAAIRAIGPKAVPFLLDWMPKPQTRRPAFVERLSGWYYRLFPPDSSKETPSPFAIEIAWWALGEQGKSAIPTLARILNQTQQNANDYSVWTISAKAISHLGPEAIVPMLTVATNMRGQHEVCELLNNFQNLGSNGAPAIPALITWADDPDEFVRVGMAKALGGIGKRADLAVPVLLKALKDTHWMVRRDTADALGAFANDSDAVLPALIKALDDPDSRARGGALSGLGRIRNKPEIVVPLIVPYLRSAEGRSAAYALLTLGDKAGFDALLRTTNAPGLGDIIIQAREMFQSQQAQ